MPDFYFEAVSKDNEPTSGRISADSASEVLASLESQGFTVHSLRQVAADEPGSAPSAGHPAAARRVSGLSHTGDDQLVRDRIGELLEQRDTLAPALEAFAEELPVGSRRGELQKLAAQLKAGETVDELYQSQDLATWLPLLSGDPSVGSNRLLHDLLGETSRESAARAQRRRAFVYPLLIIAAAVIVLLILGILVVPTFSDIFGTFSMELPTLTVLVLRFSHALRFHPWSLLLGTGITVATVYAAFLLLKSLRFPGLLYDQLTQGSSRQVAMMAAFVRWITESLGAGFPLPTSLRLAGRCTSSRWLERSAVALANQLECGRTNLDDIFRASPLPPLVLFALRAGPDGGPHVGLLDEVAEIYSERVRNRLNWSTGILPHFSILVVGAIVAAVVLALFLPLVSLINNLSK